jgi:hypothetical protein
MKPTHYEKSLVWWPSLLPKKGLQIACPSGPTIQTVSSKKKTLNYPILFGYFMKTEYFLTCVIFCKNLAMFNSVL